MTKQEFLSHLKDVLSTHWKHRSDSEHRSEASWWLSVETLVKTEFHAAYQAERQASFGQKKPKFKYLWALGFHDGVD